MEALPPFLSAKCRKPQAVAKLQAKGQRTFLGLQTQEEAVAVAALCIAARGPGAGSQTQRPVRTFSPGTGPGCWEGARTCCW